VRKGEPTPPLTHHVLFVLVDGTERRRAHSYRALDLSLSFSELNSAGHALWVPLSQIGSR
jgi:hypothetical protein